MKTQIEADFARKRESIEKQFLKDKADLEEKRTQDLLDLRKGRVNALEDAGLDGEGNEPDPQGNREVPDYFAPRDASDPFQPGGAQAEPASTQA